MRKSILPQFVDDLVERGRERLELGDVAGEGDYLRAVGAAALHSVVQGLLVVVNQDHVHLVELGEQLGRSLAESRAYARDDGYLSLEMIQP